MTEWLDDLTALIHAAGIEDFEIFCDEMNDPDAEFGGSLYVDLFIRPHMALHFVDFSINVVEDDAEPTPIDYLAITRAISSGV